MRVLYDAEIFLAQRRGGISRYFSELISAFSDDPLLGIQPGLGFSRSDNTHLRSTAAGKDLARPRWIPRGVGRLTQISERTRMMVTRYSVGSGEREADLLHATYYHPLVADIERHRNLAVTVVDLIPEILGWAGRNDPHDGKAALLRRADIGFSISETTTALLREIYPDCSAPIITTPLAVDNEVFTPFGHRSPVRESARRPYLLFVGKRGGYKSFDVFVDAYEQCLRGGLELDMVLAGPPLESQELSRLEFVGQKAAFWCFQPSDYELAALYRDALAFVFPSRFEGFGLPVLEAMSCGCPTILADTPIFREVGGGAAMYFTAGNAEALAQSIRDVAESDALRQYCVEKGFQNASRYSWRRTAELTAAGYRLALGA